MEKVSIIMPVYNGEAYLRHAVESVMKQTYPNWELLIIDDASTDNTVSEVFRLSQEDERITLFHSVENRGVGACRNSGIRKAQGEYVAFLDADDLWSVNKLEKQLAFMKAHQADFSHTAYAFIDEHGDVMRKNKVDVDERVRLEDYMKNTQIGLSSVMYNRQHIPDLRFPEDRRLGEDAVVWMNYLRQGHAFYGMNDVLLLYRIRPRQMSSNKLKMATAALRRYIAEDKVPEYKKLFYFLSYAYHATKKRVWSNQLDADEIYRHFNCHR